MSIPVSTKLVPLNLLEGRFSSSRWPYQSIHPTRYALEKKVLGRVGTGSGHIRHVPGVDVNPDNEYRSLRLVWQPSNFTEDPTYFL